MNRKDKDSIEAFYSGVISALLVLVIGHGEEEMAFDILRCSDDKAIRRIAEREGHKAIVELIDNYRKQREFQTWTLKR